MGWETSDRRSRLPADWHRIRARILRRDGYVCQATDSMGRLCLEPARDVDHIVPGDDHSETNLQALCRWHHSRKSSEEGAAARQPRPSRRRAPEKHPGLS